MKNINFFLISSIFVFSHQLSIAQIHEVDIEVQVAQPLVPLTAQEELDQLLKEEAEELLQTRIEFIKCFTTNKLEPKTSTFGCPKACHDAAFAFALIAGQDELDRVIKSLQ